MKITHLHIDNFREVRSIDLRNLTDDTILVGPNGAGKSTILDAVRVVIVGQCYDQTGKRIANDDLIGPYGKCATIDLGVEVGGKSFSLFLAIKKGGTTLSAKDPRAYEAFPGADTATKIRAALCEALDNDLARIECALNPRAYILGPELGNMLAELCAGTVDIAQVQRAADEHWDYIAQLGTEACIDWDIPGLAKLGDAAYKRRTEVKKRLAVAQQVIKDRESVEQPCDTKGNPMDPDKLQPLTQHLNKLQEERDRLISERGRLEAIGDPAAVEARRAQVSGSLMKAKVDLAAEEKLFEQASSAHNKASETALLFSDALQKVEASYKSAADRVARAEAALNALAEDTDKCAACGQGISKKLRASLRAPLENELASAKEDFGKINIDGARQTFAEHDKALTNAASQAEAARESVRKCEVAIAEIERELTALPDVSKLKTVAELNSEITAIEARCLDGRAKLEALGQWAELVKAQAAEHLLEQELSHLEWAIMVFRDGEYLKSHLSDYKGEFEGRCNAVLAPYGYALGVDVDGKHVQVTLAKEGHRPAPITQCSKAELVLAGWAVATAFAGESPICLDDMDALFGKTKNTLLKSLANRGTNAPVIVAGAWTAPTVDLEPLRKALPKASVIWVEGGEAKTQGKAVAA